MTDKNVIESKGRLNNAQRKALAEIVVRRLDARLDTARQAEGKLERQIAQEIAQRFQLAAIDGEIERLQKQVTNLQERKRELGFRDGYEHEGGGYVITGGRAKKLLQAKIERRSLAVRKLSDQRNKLQQAVWLATTVEEANAITAQVEMEVEE